MSHLAPEAALAEAIPAESEDAAQTEHFQSLSLNRTTGARPQKGSTPGGGSPDRFAIFAADMAAISALRTGEAPLKNDRLSVRKPDSWRRKHRL